MSNVTRGFELGICGPENRKVLSVALTMSARCSDMKFLRNQIKFVGILFSRDILNSDIPWFLTQMYQHEIRYDDDDV